MNERVVLFAPEAKDDLLRIYDWNAEAAGAEPALAYIGRIEAFCRSMNIASARGTRRDEIRPGLRIVGFERRLIVAFHRDADDCHDPAPLLCRTQLGRVIRLTRYRMPNELDKPLLERLLLA